MTPGESLSSSLFRTKVIEYDSELDLNREKNTRSSQLKRVLTKWDLTAIGVGAIIGAGIFVLSGVAAKTMAGPGVILSYLVAGISCHFSALSYAEFAARIPLAGSAYTYAYFTFGEFPAFFIGWDLTLEYMIGAAAVARGWSGYFVQMFEGFGARVPQGLYAIDSGHGVVMDPLAAIVVLSITFLLIAGIKGSSRVNFIFVVVTIVIILFVIFAGCAWANEKNLHPFLPNGGRGVFEGAALVFFAFIGFDAVSTTAEEVVNPKKDLPVGIIASLSIATVLYLSVAAVMVAMVKYTDIDVTAPLAAAFGEHGLKWGQSLVAIGAFAALTTSVLGNLISQPRIYYSMSRDGLLPSFLSSVRNGSPFGASIFTGIFSSILAFFIDIETLAEMVSIGTLMAFTLVNGGVLHQRYSDSSLGTWGRWRPVIYLLILLFFWVIVCISWLFQDSHGVPAIFAVITLVPFIMLLRLPTVSIPETFACPLVPFVPVMGILCNTFMMVHLSSVTWIRLLIWLVIGLFIYFGYGIRNSRLARAYGFEEHEEPAELGIKEQDLAQLRSPRLAEGHVRSDDEDAVSENIADLPIPSPEKDKDSSDQPQTRREITGDDFFIP